MSCTVGDEVIYLNDEFEDGATPEISNAPKGRYSITVENSHESFTGQFDTKATGIVEVKSKKVEPRDGIYNLQGQRISSLLKGLNIVNGRKVMVK